MPGKALRVMLCAWSCLLAGQASALGVGDITLHSALNQPLDADIELLDVGDLGADEIEVRLAGADVFAAAGVERLQFLNELRFSPVLQGRGGNRIHVSSSRPVQEPYLNFLVEVARPNGRIVREFTVLLDPLGYTPRMLPAARSGIEPQRQSSTPAPAPRSAAAVVDPALLEPGDEYLARPNDNLWAISGRLRGAGNADRAQLMEALYQLNPQAFVNADRHRLKAGARLRLPAGYQPERGAPGAVKEAAVEVLPPADAAVVENAPAARRGAAPGGCRGRGAGPATGGTEPADGRSATPVAGLAGTTAAARSPGRRTATATGPAPGGAARGAAARRGRAFGCATG